METADLGKLLKENSYPGRGIVIGRSEDGSKAVTAYFIMGRSVNSRNRVFTATEDGIKTEAFDPSKLTDPHLIIYSPVRCREFEDDAPNYTPRISGIMHVEGGTYNYAMSILKSADGDPSSCERHTFTYTNPKAGIGRFLHTYMGDGNPLPSFEGEPEKVEIKGDIDEFTANVWESLNEDNKVSLFVRYIDIATGKADTRIVNKNV